MNLSHSSLNAIFERFLAAFCLQFVAYFFKYVSFFRSKICRKSISNLIIKMSGIGS